MRGVPFEGPVAMVLEASRLLTVHLNTTRAGSKAMEIYLDHCQLLPTVIDGISNNTIYRWRLIFILVKLMEQKVFSFYYKIYIRDERAHPSPARRRPILTCHHAPKRVISQKVECVWALIFNKTCKQALFLLYWINRLKIFNVSCSGVFFTFFFV